MATTSDKFCEICEVLHITEAATVWCSECDEGLCTECQKHHSISKSSKHHNVIPIESYNKLPQTIANIVNHCENHDMKYTNYCPHHEKLCCPACISTVHQSCTCLLLLQDVIQTAKTSALLDSIELSIKDIKFNLKTIIEDRQQNLVIIHEQRQRYQDEMKQVRIKMNSHLDTLEQITLTDIDTAESKARTEINQLMTQLLKTEKATNDLEQDILVIKVYASDFQAYIGIKSIETAVEKQEQHLQSLSENGSLRQIGLNFNIDKQILNIAAIKTFGTATTVTDLPLIVLKRDKDKQAQIMSPLSQVVQKSFDDITLSQISKFTFQKQRLLRKSFEIKGISVLPDGRIILADSNNKKLLIVNNDGMLDKSISCHRAGSGPFDVTFIKDNKVAVTTGISIQIVDINSETVVENIVIGGECRGIAYNDGTLLCCVKFRGIQCIEMSNKAITTVVKSEYDQHLGIHVHRKKIYVTNCSTVSVYCYTLEGEKLWRFGNSAVLMYPTGITVDNNSNVYVASCEYSCVIVLSPDGKHFKQIISYDDGLQHPIALHFDEINNSLFVANARLPIYVYRIS